MKSADPNRSTPERTARHLGTQTFVVLLGSCFTLVVGLPLQIFVSRVLGSEGLGVFGLIEAATVTIAGFLGFGIAPMIVRFVPALLEQQQYASIRKLIRLSGFILMSVGGAAYAVLLMMVGWGYEWWPYIAEHRGAIALMGLTIPLGLVVFFLQQTLRGFQEIRYIVLGSSVVQLLTKAAATVAAFGLGMRLEGYVLAVVLSMSVAILWMGYGLGRKVLSLPAGSVQAAEPSNPAWWRFAAICYANSLVSTASGRVDWFLLGYFFGSGAVGILVVARQLQQLPGYFHQMLLVVGAPMFSAAYSRNDRDQRQHLYTLMTDWVVRASLPLVLFLLLFAHPLLSLYGAEFAERGTPTLRILVAAQFFSICCGPIGQVAIMSGLENSNLRLGIACTTLTTALTIALVPFFGLFGVAAAATFGSVLLNVVVLRLVRRRLGTVWRSARFLGWLLPAAMTFALGVTVVVSGIDLGAIELAAALITMYAVFVTVNALQGLHEDDKDFLRYLWGRLAHRA